MGDLIGFCLDGDLYGFTVEGENEDLRRGFFGRESPGLHIATYGGVILRLEHLQHFLVPLFVVGAEGSYLKHDFRNGEEGPLVVELPLGGSFAFAMPRKIVQSGGAVKSYPNFGGECFGLQTEGREGKDIEDERFHSFYNYSGFKQRPMRLT